MKLNEIFDIPNTKDDLSKDNDTHLGQGALAHVHTSKTDPHAVNKTAKPREERNSRHRYKDDSYWLYIKELMRTKIWQQNPTFPRIFIAGNEQVQMEKLISFEEIDDEQMRRYLENNFHIDISHDIEEDWDSRACNYHMAQYLGDAIYINNQSRIKSEQLIEAVEWLHDTYKRLNKAGHDVQYDLHSGNIMYRRTSHGIQLVITDPFY